jgi:signal transduction histidine kinase
MTQGRRIRQYNPAVRIIQSAWYRKPPPLIDAALAVALGGFALSEAGLTYTGAVALLTFPLIIRRRLPLPAFGLVILGAIMAVPAAPYAGLAAVMVAAYSVGAYDRFGFPSLVFLGAVAGVIAVAYRASLPAIPDHTVPFLVIVPFWLVGYALRSRQLRADALADRAARLEREQALVTHAALAEERARIARELHDVVAHNVSVIVVQAGAALEVLPRSPERAREALLAIESVGRGAMGELRNLLGVLAATDEKATVAPQPGIDQLDSLLQQVRAAGLPVEMHVEGQRHPLPAGIDLTVYRIVQEALTNALKYAGPAQTKVVLEYRKTELKLEILDAGSGERTSGQQRLADNGLRESMPLETAHRGLVGIRERVSLYGGRLEAGPRLPHGFAVRAWLPLLNGPTGEGAS